MTKEEDTTSALPRLDDTDQRILALLMTNARMPAAAIARQAGIARTTAVARIAALERRGVIAGYSVRLNADVAQPAVRAYVGIAIDPRGGPELVRLLDRLPQVETLCAVSGQVDYMLTLRCRSTAELDRVLDRIGGVGGVRQTSTSIILTRRIDRGPA